MVTRKPRLLVKTTAIASGATFAPGGTDVTLQPLFPADHRHSITAATTEPHWNVAEVAEADGDANASCHKLHIQGFGIAGAGAVDFADPDIEQTVAGDSEAWLIARSFTAANAPSGMSLSNPISITPRADLFDWRWFGTDTFSASMRRVHGFRIPRTALRSHTWIRAMGKATPFTAGPCHDAATQLCRPEQVRWRETFGCSISRLVMRYVFRYSSVMQDTVVEIDVAEKTASLAQFTVL
ncbi:MAG: hypothetical protein WBY44_21050 [Bryobacteraceae bacterium]